ncbi:MAG: 50S ribosomal protein L11 methyltransferase [Deltaproteobacteria bacterium]|nr:50S ribosomal protein L11 methyltransferase [Deltaproteobacteria bacterium]
MQARLEKILSHHAAMVLDPLRTLPLARAIEKIVKPGDVVLDIGTGIGLLSFIAARAGAKQVFAIDANSEAVEVAKSYAQQFGLADRITFFEGLSFDLELEKRVDVIICETIGSLGFDENILATLSDAKKRLLKKGGRIIPDKMELWGVPVTLPLLCKEGQGEVDLNSDLLTWSNVADFDFAQTIGKIRSRKPLKSPLAKMISPKSFLAKPQKLSTIDFQASFKSFLHTKTSFRFLREGVISGMGLWPVVRWAKGLTTDCSPGKPHTHWGQGVLDLPKQKIITGEKKTFELIIEPHPEDPMRNTEILWKIK